MNEKRLIIILTTITTVILFGGIYILSSTTNTPQVAKTQNAKAYVALPTSYDWGNIPYGGGVVQKIFTIKNSGTETLKLFNVKTSCHCTKAYVTVNGSSSPNFGMDSLSSWTGEVEPGKEAELTVVFDPAYHGPSGIGPITRFVSVETNDRANSKITFTLTGKVVK